MRGPTVAERQAPRRTAVAGAFYPADPGELRALVSSQLAEAELRYPTRAAGATSGVGGPSTGVRGVTPLGLLVPHAGLVYSGVVAAAAWHAIAPGEAPGAAPVTVIILGTNHRAGWLAGIGTWDRGPWQTPLGAVPVDEPWADAIGELGPPFVVDRDAHRAEHSIEVQLPFLRAIAVDATIVPLAVSAGVGRVAIEAGARLGTLLAARGDATGHRIVVAISSDMAHYPSAADARRVTASLLPPLLELEPEALAARESALRRRGIPGLACGMCGIEPAVTGLAVLRALGATTATEMASATSADGGGPRDRTVGYLALRFD